MEAEGTVEIKFKTKDLVKTMARLDKQYINLQETLKKPGLSPDERQKLETELKERETLLAPIYHQVSHAHLVPPTLCLFSIDCS